MALAAVLTVTAGQQIASASGAERLDAAPKREQQPRMRAALRLLREARAELQNAEHDKGGWRAKAVEATTVAIQETERGIAFDNKH